MQIGGGLSSKVVLLGGMMAIVVQAQLLVTKEFETSQLVMGKSNKITYHMYNVGKDPITKVKLTDETFKNGNFAIEEGVFPVDVPKIKPKEKYSYQIEVKPTTVGKFPDLPASVKYNGGVDEVEKKGMSTSRGLVMIISEEDYYVHVKSHRKEWMVFLALAILITGIPYWRYQLALKELDQLMTKSK